MDTLLEALLDSPDLPQKVEAMRRVLESEGERRLRFYAEMKESQKVEFINGRVIMQSPAKFRHIDVSDRIQSLLYAYVEARRLGVVTHEKMLISLTRNDYEPDVSFFRAEKAADFTPEQMRFPAPDFIAEVLSPSTESYDRRIKFRDYALHGVSEYWIVDAVAEKIEQYILHGEEYQQAGVWSGDDQVASSSIAGFDIPARAIFEREAYLTASRRLSVPGI
jgi:Uma2 family endonuclease